jgi:hypothetical protein
MKRLSYVIQLPRFGERLEELADIFVRRDDAGVVVFHHFLQRARAIISGSRVPNVVPIMSSALAKARGLPG